jgi:hypothetical protein
MYMNVLCFFVMHEICVHTIFEPSAKNTFPSIDLIPHSMRLLCNNIADENFPTV